MRTRTPEVLMGILLVVTCGVIERWPAGSSKKGKQSADDGKNA
jgi:hypothetical protein